MRKNSKKGFTLAELLIVIAIIAILIAIAIPVFSSQLENAKLQADHSNMRSAYALVQTVNLLGASTDTIDGYTNAALNATYCTDGKFHVSTTSVTPVEIQASDNAHKGNGSDNTTADSCKACVVNCKTWTAKGQHIVIAGIDEDGDPTTTEADVVTYVLGAAS